MGVRVQYFDHKEEKSARSRSDYQLLCKLALGSDIAASSSKL